AHVAAFAGHAVVGGLVPADQRLPDVVVGEVAVLVVGRVDVRDVGGGGRGGGGGLAEGAALAGARARGELWEKQRQGVVGARGPVLEVGHLKAGGGVDAVRGLHQ